MILSRIYRNEPETALTFASTKKIRLSPNSELYFQIVSNKSSHTYLLEAQIIELCTEMKIGKDTNEVFLSKILELLNRRLLADTLIYKDSGLRAFIGITEGDELSFSVCSDYQVYLQQKEKVIDIASGMGTLALTFSYVSTGAIGENEVLFVCNRDILSFLTTEDTAEFHSSQDPEIIEQLLSRESDGTTVHCLAFYAGEQEIQTEERIHRRSDSKIVRFGMNQFDKFIEVSKKVGTQCIDILNKVEWKKHSTEILHHPSIQSLLEKKSVRVGIFISGIGLAGGLLYMIVLSIFTTSMSTAVPVEYKSKLIEAKEILDRSGRDIANKEMFRDNIATAEKLIFEVREQKMFANDVNSLLDQIANLKRQVNGIESVNTETSPTLYQIPKNSEAIDIFEHGKKYYIVATNGVYGPMIAGAEPKFAALPEGEVASSADIGDDGTIFMLTESNRVIKYTKGENKYVNLEGQQSWQGSTHIHSYIGNIYLLSDTMKQIFRHRPNVNGFTAKNPIFVPENKSEILDFTISNGFLMIQSDGTINKVFTSPKFEQKGLVLNKLPDNYHINAESHPRIFGGKSGQFIYILLDKKVWIFQTDTKNFKDLRNITYLGQLEIPGKEIRSLSIPKDGELLGLTSNEVISMKFEISDGKIILR